MKTVSICIFIGCVSNIWKAVSLEICREKKEKKTFDLKQYSKSHLNPIK